MTLPFVRQYPGGRRGLSEVSLFPAIEKLGQEFIAKGGRYLIEILGTGQARLVACVLVDGEQKDVEEIVCDNDKFMLSHVNQLVSNSAKHIGILEARN
jgi:hypothetical protein